MNLSEIVQRAGAADKRCQQTGCSRPATVAIVVTETLRYYYCDAHAGETCGGCGADMACGGPCGCDYYATGGQL